MDDEKTIKSSLKTSEDVVEYIKQSNQNSSDMSCREVKVLDSTIYVIYNETVSNAELISNFVIRSLKNINYENIKINKINEISQDIDKYINKNLEVNDSKFAKRQKTHENLNKVLKYNELSIDVLISNLQKDIDMAKVKKIDIKEDDIFYYLFSGFTAIVYNTDIIVVETKANLYRSIDTPITENTIKGPKDAFTENYQSNIGLIRKRIKSEKLVLEENDMGRRSKTKVGIMYISDIAKVSIVKEIKKKLEKVEIDAILDSNYIVELLEEKPETSFPTMISTERPDLVSMYLLEGRVAIVVENSPFVLVLPAFMEDFVNSMDDYYQKSIDVTFTKIIRYIALIITIFTPAVYISLITFNQEAIPTDLLLSFVAQRKGVPFPAFVESILMIISFEILREGDFRVPNVAGSTLSIVGALILGDAAVSAGIVSPIMIIVVAITTISGLMFSDINMSNALRAWRLIFLVFASLAGFIGVAAASLFFITKISSTSSFTKPMTYPMAPINFKNIFKNLLKRDSIKNLDKRDEMLTDNLVKLKNKE